MSGIRPQDAATQQFVHHRELLFSIVYNMLGSVADTEDVLQETWLSWVPRAGGDDKAPIDNPRAYLVRTAVNHALARRAALTRRKETYVGQWLPEPVVTPLDEGAEHVERTESFSMALLVVLETLSPLERAVFVLHEAFGFAYTEIAEMLDRNPTAVRQVAHRAREHVRARRTRYPADPRRRREATDRFLTAALGGDLDALMSVLAPDVTLWTDGGGKGPAVSLRPIHGRDAVARLFIGVAGTRPPGLAVRYRRVNGDPSAVLFVGDAPFAVLVLDLAPDGEQICGIYSVTNPDKLSGAR
jgi:RNA polymerase sigma factor (sigma-70 family)